MAVHVRAETPDGDYHLCANKLPHQFGTAEQQRRFPTATSAEKLYRNGEEDQTPEAELADPMPVLEKRQGGSRLDPRVSGNFAGDALDFAGDAQAAPERRQGNTRFCIRVSEDFAGDVPVLAQAAGGKLAALRRGTVKATGFSAALVEQESANRLNIVFSSTSHFGGLRATTARAGREDLQMLLRQ